MARTVYKMQQDELLLYQKVALTSLHGGQEIMMMSGEAQQMELEMFVTHMHVLLENIPH